MKMKSRSTALVLILMLVLTVAAGCGQGNIQQPSTATTQTPAEASAPPAETGNAPSDASATPNVDAIKAAGKIIMLTNAAFAPFEYVSDSGEIMGVDVEIAQAVAAELGVELEIVDMEFESIIMALQNGQGDIAVAGMTADDERRQSIDFSVNYLDATQVIIVPEGSDIKTADDLAGKTIGVQAGTTGALFVEETYGHPTGFTNGPTAGLALANGQIDAVVIDQMPAQQIVAANEGLTIIEEPLTEEEYAIGIAKGKEDLKAVVDGVLNKLIADGTIDALIAKHVGE